MPGAYMTKTQAISSITLQLNVGRRVVMRAMEILEEQGIITFESIPFDARVQRISQEDMEKVIAYIKEHI